MSVRKIKAKMFPETPANCIQISLAGTIPCWVLRPSRDLLTTKILTRPMFLHDMKSQGSVTKEEERGCWMSS